ncbi:MAG: isoamylase early set domain-containing protein [Limisphaerales bacterium]
MAKTAKKKQQENLVEQVFSYTAPGALSVLLAGDFTHWQSNPIPMKKQPDGTWRATVKLAPGTYHYRFIVDGEWRDDPECTLRVPNPFGQENCVRVVSAQGQ